jgi:thiol-disulfide isomerase/thioredoxin
MTKKYSRFAPVVALVLCLLLAVAALSGCSGDKASEKAGGTAAQDSFPKLDMPALEKRLADNKGGKVTLIMFWATWCPACKTELPVLEQLRAKYPADKLEILAVSVDDTEQVMRSYVATRPTTLPILLGTADVSTSFGVKSIPALVIFDRESQVAFNSTGAYPFEMLDSVISQLVKG